MTAPLIDRLDQGTALIAELMRTRWVPLDQTKWQQALDACDLKSWQWAIRFHGVAGLVYHHHEAQLADLLPADYLAVLQQQHDRFRMKALKQAGVMKQLLNLMNDAGLPFMPLKGVTLSAQLYDDFAVRLAGDLDALVDEHDLDQAVALLVANGWRRDPDYDLADPLLRQRALAYLRHVRLVSSDGQILELHWRTAATLQRSLPPLRDIADQAGSKECHGLIFPVLPEQLHMMLIAHHSASAMVGRFKWGFDVVDLMAQMRLAGHLPQAMSRSISAVINIMSSELRVERNVLLAGGEVPAYPLTDRLALSVHKWERARLYIRGTDTRMGVLASIKGRLLRTAYYACLHGWKDFPGYIGGEIGRWLYTDAPSGQPVKSVWGSVRGRLPRLRKS